MPCNHDLPQRRIAGDLIEKLAQAAGLHPRQGHVQQAATEAISSQSLAFRQKVQHRRLIHGHAPGQAQVTKQVCPISADGAGRARPMRRMWRAGPIWQIAGKA